MQATNLIKHLVTLIWLNDAGEGGEPVHWGGRSAGADRGADDPGSLRDAGLLERRGENQGVHHCGRLVQDRVSADS